MLLILCSLCLQKVEKLKATLHNLDNQPSNRHIYFAEDRFVIESFGFGGVAEQELFFSSCRLSELFPFQFYFWFNTCELNVFYAFSASLHYCQNQVLILEFDSSILKPLSIREEANELQSKFSRNKELNTLGPIPKGIKR